MSERILKEGERVKDFELQGISHSGEEKNFTLDLLLEGKEYLILYFYPKDNTSGCTQEAKDFRDVYDEIKNKFEVCGVSPDSIESHKKFMKKHSLNFPLLSDRDKKIMAYFGAYGEKKMYGKIKMGVIRSTFIISKDKVLIKAWRNVRAKGHVEKVIEWINKNLK